MEMFIVIGFVVFWIALQAWILPWCGIPTCMSGACRPSAAASPAVKKDVPGEAATDLSPAARPYGE